MSITAIQQSDSLYGLFGTNTRPQADSATAATFSPEADTVTLSEEALALIRKLKAQKAEEEEEKLLQDAAAQAEETGAATKVTAKDMSKSLFAIMLESLFLADLEENSQAAAQSAEDGMPQKRSSPLENSEKATQIKKVMNDVASGKADISDLPKAMAMQSGAGSGKQTNAPAAKQVSETTDA